MVCKNCQAQSHYIRLLADGSERCHNCGGFSEAGGFKTGGVLTRASFRVRSEAYKHQGDTLTPFTYNKATKKMDINQDFVKLYPNEAKQYYTDAEMKGAGLPKLAERANKIKALQKQHKEDLHNSVEFAGSQEKAMGKVLTP